MKAYYAGSFDPPTLGHIHVISVALGIFSEVFVAVGINPNKTSLFTAVERIKMIRTAFPRRVAVHSFDNYMVHNAMDMHCTHIVRGIRNGRDLEDEMAMAELNKTIGLTHPKAATSGVPQTIFIPTPPNLALVSSSMVKSLIGFGDWQEQIKQYVPFATYEALLRKYDTQR